MSHISNITEAAQSNTFFRKVIFTGAKSQLVVMSIPPSGEIGEETHEHVEQTLFVERGEGVAVLNGVESPFKQGDALVVTPGTRHNVVNRSATDLKLFTVYAPPNHIDGRIHETKADADKDHEDEAFGHSQ
jgi:mannose-6-phosphate isomerase-like protein (cupin superfamily)